MSVKREPLLEPKIRYQLTHTSRRRTPFSHVRIDCIGPLIPVSDATVMKPFYNHAMVIVDKFSSWLAAYPLNSMAAKNVCEFLIQFFMTFDS